MHINACFIMKIEIHVYPKDVQSQIWRALYKLIVFTTFCWETSDKLYNRVCPCFRDFAENNTPRSDAHQS